MGTFLKYLLSLAFHTAWMRSGKSGPLPPIRLRPGKGALPLPAIGPWQMLLFTWVLQKLWHRYGDGVRARVADVDHPVARRVHDWMPSTNPNRKSSHSNSEPPATLVIPGIPATAPAGAAATSPRTRRLPRQTPTPKSSGSKSSGSLLSRLRKGA